MTVGGRRRSATPRRLSLVCLAATLLAAPVQVTRAAEPAGLLQQFGRGRVILIPDESPCVLIDVFVASTPEHRAQGLMHIERLEPGEGMLFVYARSASASMWMKNTLIPLDMIFVRQDMTIARIETDTEPGSLRPIASGEPVLWVLELNSGSAQRLGLRPGNRLLGAGT